MQFGRGFVGHPLVLLLQMTRSSLIDLRSIKTLSGGPDFVTLNPDGPKPNYGQVDLCQALQCAFALQKTLGSMILRTA